MFVLDSESLRNSIDTLALLFASSRILSLIFFITMSSQLLAIIGDLCSIDMLIKPVAASSFIDRISE